MKKEIIILVTIYISLILFINAFTGICVTRDNPYGGWSTQRETFLGKKFRNIGSNFALFRISGIGDYIYEDSCENKRADFLKYSLFQRLIKSLKD